MAYLSFIKIKLLWLVRAVPCCCCRGCRIYFGPCCRFCPGFGRSYRSLSLICRCCCHCHPRFPRSSCFASSWCAAYHSLAFAGWSRPADDLCPSCPGSSCGCWMSIPRSCRNSDWMWIRTSDPSCGLMLIRIVCPSSTADLNSHSYSFAALRACCPSLTVP